MSRTNDGASYATAVTGAMFLPACPAGEENMAMGQPPTIMPLEFVPARQVLAREDADFTHWLSGHLEYLEPVLGLTSMELVATESPVGSFFLDIRATGVDTQGQAVAVPIENQYGRTDHDHLGKLITYTGAGCRDRGAGPRRVDRGRR